MKYSKVQNSALVQKCRKEALKKVQIGRLKSQRNGLEEGNLTLVSA